MSAAFQRGREVLVQTMNTFIATRARGVGASHQTGWTALLACMILDLAETSGRKLATIGSEQGLALEDYRACDLANSAL
jgi:hypothetical protein